VQTLTCRALPVRGPHVGLAGGFGMRARLARVRCRSSPLAAQDLGALAAVCAPAVQADSCM